MRKIGHKIAKPFFFAFLATNLIILILLVFHSLFTGFSLAFHGFFMFFSRCQVSTSPFSQISKLRPQFFKHWISLGVGPCSAKSHKNMTSKIIT